MLGFLVQTKLESSDKNQTSPTMNPVRSINQKYSEPIKVEKVN